MFLDEIANKFFKDKVDFAYPRTTLLGRGFVVIEGHRGIVFFSNDNVKIRLSKDVLEVVGTDLQLSSSSNSELIISGNIKEMRYV